MEFVGKTNIDFLSMRRGAFALSLVLVLLGVVACVQIARGRADLGIDFAGGTSIQVRFDDPVELGEVRRVLAAGGVAESELQQFVGGRRLFTRVKSRRPPTNCWSSLSATPPAARTRRTSPSSTGSSKRTWMEVPPAKSIPRSARPRAIWTHATTPRRTSTSERAKAPRRMLRKSMFVLPTNSIARRPRLRGGPSDTELLHSPKGQPVEDHPGPHGRRKQIDGHAEG